MLDNTYLIIVFIIVFAIGFYTGHSFTKGSIPEVKDE